ncbi:MAG TPA: hypothetical protein PKE01_02865 [Rhodocyclaceae bacterium]|nr:hypothetical protein [Rhodocyclaceae bacterium]HNC79721.1 hypothetical protein [Rhodocyclaceae bacterium]
MARLALISLHDTTGLVDDARRLIGAGFTLLASRESSSLIAAAGLPVIDLADYTALTEDFGFPPTLHPKLERALTARPADLAEPAIELAYINPYPADVGNDVGGRTILMLAVKGQRLAASSRADLHRVLACLETGGDLPALRRQLADAACFSVARHFAGLISPDAPFATSFGEAWLGLAEGENPFQRPAVAYRSGDPDPLALSRFRLLGSQPPCFTNAADADAILHHLCLLAEGFEKNTGTVPWLCIAAKHGNACGIGVSRHAPREAIDRALAGNPRAIWGGEVIVNFPIDGELAAALFASDEREVRLGSRHWMLDVVMAPAFTAEAAELLGRREFRKLLANPALAAARLPHGRRMLRPVRGGALGQPVADYVLELAACAGNARFDEAAVTDLLIAWSAAYSSNHGGNEVALARGGMLLAAGGGPSTVDAARSAVTRCAEQGHDATGAAFAADAFFPFTDAPQIVADAGARCGAVPDGSRNDDTVKAFFRERHIAVAWIPAAFRGFCRH